MNSSLHESSSAHSISSAPSSSLPWGYSPSHSDSNSSISSLTKAGGHHHQHRGAPVRSDSSGSLGQVSRITQTPSGSNTSVNSGNNNNNNHNSNSSSGTNTPSHGGVGGGGGNSTTVDNFASLTHARPFHSHPNPSAFQSRLSSRSEGHINSGHQSGKPQPPPPPSFLASSKYAVVHPPVPSPAASPRTEHISKDVSSSLSLPAHPSRCLDLGVTKRSSTDSTLSQPDGSLSPTGSGPPFPLRRDDSSASVSSLGSGQGSIGRGINRLSPQSQTAVHMGISSVQRKLQEQERTKIEYEAEVHVLRQQLLDAQERLQQADLKLLDHEENTHQLLGEWQNRLEESKLEMRRQQEEKDVQMKAIVGRLQSIEEELKREHAEMSQAVEHKTQVIEVQEQRLRTLDQANNRLLQALKDLKGNNCNTEAEGALSGGYKTSTC